MKILHVCDTVLPAKDAQGTQRMMQFLAQGQKELGHDVYFMARKGSASSICPIVNELIPCDMVHYHGWFPDYFNHQLPQNRWINTSHGGGHDGPNSFPDKYRKNVVGVSKFIMKKLDLPYYVYNCVDIDQYRFVAKKSDFFLWMAGTDWAEQKGLFSSISIAKKTKVKLKIAGSGQNTGVIETIKSLCDSNIEYVGSVDGQEKLDLLAKAKALLMIGDILDACPLTSIEAWASGTPVIAKAVGVHPELVNEHVGFLCKTESDIVKSILNARNINSLSCRQYANNWFSHREIARQYVELYKKVIG